MKILSWNIAGAHIFTHPISQALNNKNYEHEDIAYFLKHIKATKADIILLQEAHSEEEESQGKIFAKKLSYPYVKEQIYGKSHITSGQQLTLVTLSKYPISSSYFHLLPNPKLTTVRENGEEWETLDTGFLVTEIDFDNQKVHIANCHLVPYHYFHRNFSEQSFQYIRDDITHLLTKLAEKPSIVGGDFNYADLTEVLPSIGSVYEEAFVKRETAPGKGQQDHVLFTRQWQLNDVQLKRLKADHFQCIVEVSLRHE
jgi:endonuclease/exonuclease/phosphatase family metal-dependent hydrolase